MFQILGFLFLLALVIGLVVLFAILRIVFGGLNFFRNLGRGGGRRTGGNGFDNWHYTYRQGGSGRAGRDKEQTVSDQHSADRMNRKIFDKNDGEYVDYEEIK